MAMDLGGKKGVKSDINVTPLIDVVLVLLIIFMVVTPLTQRGYDLEVPQEATSVVPPSQDELDKQVILSISGAECPILTPLANQGLPAGCRVRVNKELVAIADLPRRMDEIFSSRRRVDRILFLAAEEKLNYEGVIQILDKAKAGGGEELKIALVKSEDIATQAASGAAEGALGGP